MLRNGFKQGCRQIIGLDGTFLKSIIGGALLDAIGKDKDNRMFHITWQWLRVKTNNILDMVFRDIIARYVHR